MAKIRFWALAFAFSLVELRMKLGPNQEIKVLGSFGFPSLKAIQAIKWTQIAETSIWDLSFSAPSGHKEKR